MTPRSIRTWTRRGSDDTDIAVEGVVDGPPDVVYVHATGFCKELWRPVAEAVADRRPDVGWVSIDQRGHGHSGRGSPPYLWDHLARDVLAVVEEGSRPLGVGHSSGGAALARAEILAPGTFSGLVLIEPIVFPPPFERRDIHLAQGAERRRGSFPDHASARERFADGPFGGWRTDVLDLYVDHAFAPDDHGLVLRCAPEVEADFYREGSNHDTWDHLDEIAVPVVLVAGARSDSHREPYLSLLRDRFAAAELVVLPGLGHLAPMEDPDAVASVVIDAVPSARGRTGTIP
jgi:pimeloyl-ACP methyl ester carboxylesterase